MDLLQQSITNTANFIRQQLDTSSDDQPPLRQQLTDLLASMDAFQVSTAQKSTGDYLRPESEDKYRALFAAIDEGVCIIQVLFDDNQKPVDYRFIEVNHAFERHTGLQNVTGKRVREMLPLHEQHWFDIYGKVALSGEAVRFEDRADQLSRIFDVYAFRVGEPHEHQVAVVFNDITDRKRREMNAAFLNGVSEMVMSLSTPQEIVQALGEQFNRFFGASVVTFIQINETKDEASVTNDWSQTGGLSLIGKYNLPEYVSDEFRAEMAAGHTMILRDVAGDERIVDKEKFAALKIGSFINVPLIRDGEWKFTLGAYHEYPYDWRDDQIDLLLEVTARIWNKLERVYAETALRESEMKYRTLFESMDEGYILIEVIFDENDVPVDILYLDANPASVKMTGTQLVGKTARQVDPNFEAHWYEVFGRIAKTGVGERHELTALPLNMWYNVYAFKVGEQESRRVAAVYQDVTEHKRAEVAAQREAALDAYRVDLADALQPLTDPVAIQTEATRILGEHLKVSRAHYGEVGGDTATVVIDQGYTHKVRDFSGRYMLPEMNPDLSKRLFAGSTLVIPDMQQAPGLSDAQRERYAKLQIGAQVVVPLIKGGRLAAGISVHQSEPRAWTPDEVTLIEETAERTWAAVAHARQVQQAQELAVLRDRHQLARDLHDAVTQTLFSASILSSSIVQMWDKNQEKIPRLLTDLNTQVRGALAEMRTLLLELRPDSVEKFAFTRLLQQLIEAVQSRKYLEINLEFDGEATLPPDVHVVVYRIVQEALNNITKHSEATTTTITGRGGDGFVDIVVQDNGVGFNAAELSSGLGMQIMRERAKEVNARLEIDSTPGQGTRVHVSWSKTG